MPPIAIDRRNADAIAAQVAVGTAPVSASSARTFGAIRLQRVDAQVERRTLRQRPRFGDPVVAIRLTQQRNAPVRTIGGNRIGRGRGLVPLDGRDFGRGQGGGRKAVAVELGVQSFGQHAVDQKQRAEAESARRVRIEQPGRRPLSAQGVVDDVADGGAVAGAGEAVRQAPILQRVGDRAVSPLDVLQHLDRCRQPSAKSHVRHPGSVNPLRAVLAPTPRQDKAVGKLSFGHCCEQTARLLGIAVATQSKVVEALLCHCS